MPEINHTVFDRTLAEIDLALCKKKVEKPFYKRVNAGTIGDECLRKLWYDFHIVSENVFDAESMRRFDDGHTQELKMEERFRLLPFIELHTKDPARIGEKNQQYRATFLDGHFSMYSDGFIKGIIESPNKWHVWEHKAVNEDDFNKLKKLRIKHGEKKCLIEWNYKYWSQAQSLMAGFDLDRHFLTVSTPGGRDYISVRTERSLGAIDAILEKAHAVINGKIPERISQKREFYLCKFCNHFGVCWDGAVPLRNCGTCSMRTPGKSGSFSCLFREKMVNMEACGEYDILDDFDASAIIQSSFRGEKIEGVKINGWK